MRTTFLTGGDSPGTLCMRRGPLEGSGAALAYLVFWSREPTGDQLRTLEGIVRAKASELPESGAVVVTRRGLTGSWTSRATGILRRCGLPVERIERAALLEGGPPEEHDPLLEEVLAGPEIASWPDRGARPPEPEERCALGGDPRAGLGDLLRARGIEVPPSTVGEMAAVLGGLGRPPSWAEVTVLAQVNSDHCRHLTFGAQVEGAGESTPLIESLKATLDNSPGGVLAAYEDNAAVFRFGAREDFAAEPGSRAWRTVGEGDVLHTVLKSETHNHPTAVAPHPGAATGVGGEIRDEAAAGTGASSVAGFAGYIVGDIGEQGCCGGSGVQDPLRILVEAPLGAAAFSNEFGRPTVAGFCRTFRDAGGARTLGFRKPVMLAGGIGSIRERSVGKKAPRPGDAIVHLGGPGMRVGMGGSLASSGGLGDGVDASESVQRDDAEMQRRAQEVIDACARDADSPLRSVHDVGAGGLANAVGELVRPLGCRIDLDAVPSADEGMTDAEVLCNEAQERFVALVDPGDVERLAGMCLPERCPFAVIGSVTDEGRFAAAGSGGMAVDLPAGSLFLPGDSEPLRAAEIGGRRKGSAGPAGIDLSKACHAVLAHPSVADKSFLVTISDRTVGGLVARDQMVGPWQAPVADCAVALAGHRQLAGRAFALGERAAVAAVDPAAAARLAVAEALTNLASAPVGGLGEVRLSLNWMADASDPEGAGDLVAAVRGVCGGFLRELGVAVVAGKDSVSMRAEVGDGEGGTVRVSSPATCVATACGHVEDATAALTPEISGRADTVLMLVAAGPARGLGASALCDALSMDGGDVPDVCAVQLKAWWRTVEALHGSGVMLAYHDISDGGMLAAACEMAFASGSGVTLVLDAICQPEGGLETDADEMSPDALSPGGIDKVARELFSEGAGAVIEVAREDAARVIDAAAQAGLGRLPQTIGWPTRKRSLKVFRSAVALVDEPVCGLTDSWSRLSDSIRKIRDGPEAVQGTVHSGRTRLHATPAAPFPAVRKQRAERPAAVVLRDQGTNGHVEMAAALDAAGFEVRIVPLSALPGEDPLSACRLLALPGGFSHGDVLGAGAGTAHAILSDDGLRRMFRDFFSRPTLALGVCNGCQVLARLSELYAPEASMPRFLWNASRRFEARLSQVEVLPNPSPFLSRLAGARLPVPVSCGEGRAALPAGLRAFDTVPAMRFVDGMGMPAERHPQNPTGSPGGLCGFATRDGKVTLLMPHPERAVRTAHMSWAPQGWDGGTLWLDCFAHARERLLSVCDN